MFERRDELRLPRRGGGVRINHHRGRAVPHYHQGEGERAASSTARQGAYEKQQEKQSVYKYSTSAHPPHKRTTPSAKLRKSV